MRLAHTFFLLLTWPFWALFFVTDPRHEPKNVGAKYDPEGMFLISLLIGVCALYLGLSAALMLQHHMFGLGIAVFAILHLFSGLLFFYVIQRPKFKAMMDS
jgi:hypothetical protein